MKKPFDIRVVKGIERPIAISHLGGGRFCVATEDGARFGRFVKINGQLVWSEEKIDPPTIVSDSPTLNS